ALMFLDLDHFKNVNDSLGHRIGDALLRALAGRLSASVRDQDTVSRLGGDEFILVLPDTDALGAAHVAEKLMGAALEPFNIESHELTVTPSIGIAMYPTDGTDFDTLSRCADAAMYHAKQRGRNHYRFFTAEMQATSERTLVLENALRRALDRNQLQLHYQPQVSLDTGAIVGAEALLRWNHPELGSISPAEFIPVAESSGLILPIGEWVLRTAVRQLRQWLGAGVAPICMAVNLSAVQFRQAEFPQLIARILEEENLPAHLLELELTEGVAMTDPNAAIGMMDKLHQHGVRMSIDDFGTGYSSLNYLKKFKVYKVKIDRSFVRDIAGDPDDRAIVSAIISMSRSLGMQTIAEGVETAEQLAYLKAQGCGEVQGYYFSKPVPAEAFVQLLQKSIPMDGSLELTP
ncbi:MAG TPA: bifunctional diguanylate cyclase/phosphodiesterase, partial [Rhodoferax sp.]|nr:bifunctional diguanylate cyclase/phosphodiesterase [Rhodoferax sp.]